MIKIIKYFLLSLLLISCGQIKDSARFYTEITSEVKTARDQDWQKIHAPFLEGKMSQSMDMSAPDAQTQAMLEASKANLPLSWKTPEGWIEQVGSGMRLVTFVSKEEPQFQCAVTSLQGSSGGLKANVLRWIKQIELPDLNEDELKDFMNKQEKIISQGKLNVQVIDLTQLYPYSGVDTYPSMLAAIIEFEGSTIFIKMTGSFGAILRNRDKFKELCASLKIND